MRLDVGWILPIGFFDGNLKGSYLNLLSYILQPMSFIEKFWYLEFIVYEN
jgi:hypothetical protein